ncbi:MAG TPA: GNAT family N-acetyltransferase [Pyrinomonadaceae bacterium]|nr:GNAT family N-acetyltransferase [Pyrinomonadaceae bacterium]
MIPASSILTPVSNSDEAFLVELYASTRAEEMALVPWSGEQKQAFLRMQFEAQDQYYRERYPNASFDLIKLNDHPVGRLYLAELADEIRIIDLAFLPAHFDAGVFVALVEEVLQKGARVGKPVSVYLEINDPNTEIFVRLGFRKIGEQGIYFLWQHDSAVLRAAAEA